MIELADTPPTRCAACFGQYPDRRHVDMGASYEGPVFDAGVTSPDGTRNVIPHSIDELVICEDCLTTAAGLLGLRDPEQLAKRLEALEAETENLRERLLGASDYADKLEEALKSKNHQREKVSAGG